MKELNNLSARKFVPNYTYHVDESVVYIRDGRVFGTIEINGFSHEAVNDSEIVTKHNTVNDLFLMMTRTNEVSIWTHMIKKKDSVKNIYKIEDNNFLQDFYTTYVNNISKNNFFKTKYYVTFGVEVSDKKSKEGVDFAVDKMNEILLQAKKILVSFGVKALTIKENECSEIADYLAFLINHKNYNIPLSSTELSDSIVNSDQFFGFDAFQFQNYEDNEIGYGVNYIVKDFPRKTEIGHYDFLLKLPYEFVLTQSFVPMNSVKSIQTINAQLNKLRSTNNYSEELEAELVYGSQTVQAGESSIGSYHSVLTVFGKTFEEAKENGVAVSSEFLSSGKGFRYIKATYDSVDALYSHLPLSKNRPLATLRSTGNLSCLNSFHNFSGGKERGNPIGDGTAIIPLKTNSDSIFYFNTHVSDLNKDVLGKKIAGHALILGATGTGKTTFEAAASAFMQRWNPQMFVVDYNNSTELFVRAFGGVYFDIKEGVNTGINPFQLGDSSDLELMAFLKSWVKRCAIRSDGSAVTDVEAQEIDHAVDSVMELDGRQFGLLLQFINNGDLYVRLAKFAYERDSHGNVVRSGALAWALDSAENIFNPNEHDIVGFDTTAILESSNGENHPACEAILSVLFFYKTRMQKANRTMLSIIEEFWKPANFPMTQEMIKGALKAGRIKGEMMWLTSQSPEDAINCKIFDAIVQQTSTKVCLPNPDAEYDGYAKIGLTKKEFKRLKALGRESRMMLVKQSGSSVFAKLDLHGFDDYLPILSCSKEGIAIAKEIIDEFGSDPNIWIPKFIQLLNDKDT